MAVPLAREGWLQAFNDRRAPNGFLTGFFDARRPGNISKSDKVSIDITRSGEKVAVTVTKRTGPNMNDIDVFTTKTFTPPTYNEAFALNAADTINRLAGVDPYSAADMEYSAQLTAMIIDGMSTMSDKISRGVELQAAQVLQTGKLSLIDESGAVEYELDFKPKTSHFPDAAATWSGASDKLNDLEQLAKVIRKDGKVNPNTLIFGSTALHYFLQDEEVQAQLDNRSMNIGELDPRMVESGATFYGTVQVGTYKFQIWAYDDTYEAADTGTPTEYVDTDNVIMLSTRTRLDLVSAVVPLVVSPDPRVASLMPGRLSNPEAGYDVTPNIYPATNNKAIFGELETRPLCAPTQIDGFGCLNTAP